MKRLPLLVVTGGACALLVAPARGATEPVPAGDGMQLLRDAARAADRLSYRGTEFVSVWSRDRTTTAMVEVSHAPGVGTLIEIAATPANSGRAILRPDGDPTATGVGITGEALNLIERNYSATVTGSDAVAGRVTDVVLVADAAGRPVARFWVDRSTRLVLRRAMFDHFGRTLRESAFLSIVFGPVRLPQRMAAAPVIGSTGRSVAPAAVPDLVRSGWAVPAVGERFQLVGARLVDHDGRPALQLTYSDGVSTVSVFQQRGRLDSSELDGWTREQVGGARVWLDTSFPRRMVWSGRGTVYTVVAECPEAVLDGFVRALPHGERRPGVVTRFRRGVARVGSWFNPFG